MEQKSPSCGKISHLIKMSTVYQSYSFCGFLALMIEQIKVKESISIDRLITLYNLHSEAVKSTKGYYQPSKESRKIMGNMLLLVFKYFNKSMLFMDIVNMVNHNKPLKDVSDLEFMTNLSETILKAEFNHKLP